MKRYLVEVQFHEEKRPERMKQPKNFVPVGEGTILMGADLEEGAAHVMNVDQPEEFNRLVLH